MAPSSSPDTSARYSTQYKTQLEAVERISQALFQSIDVDTLVETALRIALDETDAEAGSILLANVETEQLVFHCSVGDKPVPRGTAIPWDKGISGAVFHSGHARITRQVEQDAAHLRSIDQTTGFVTRDMVTVPLRRWHREPIGVLNVLNKRNGTLADSDLGLLTIIAAFAALAIQQARQFEDTKKAEVITLLGDIGHDMENLLTPVQAGIDLLKDVTKDVFTAMETSGSARQKLYDQSFQIAQNGIRRLHDRVKEIADCVKGLSAPPVFAPCRLDVVVQEVFQTLRGLAADKRIALLGNGLTSLPAIYADERRLYNAFYNLINNAIPETPDGGAITVRGCLDSDGRAVVVAVQDTGRGMPSEIRDRLFSVRAVSTKKSGTGLGTKIVKDVIDAHKGTIRVDSEPGRGTTFHLRLPLDPRSTSC